MNTVTKIDNKLPNGPGKSSKTKQMAQWTNVAKWVKIKLETSIGQAAYVVRERS